MATDTQESSADIIAEMRDLAEHRDWNNHTSRSNRERISNLADRIEAARKREVDELTSAIQATVGRSDAEIDRLRREIAELKRAGNAAKLRECGDAAKLRECGDAAKLREAMKRIVAASLVAKNANAPGWILQRMAGIFAVATTSLVAPPRNCDKCETKDTAREAFQKLRGHRVLADVSLWDDRDEIEAFLDWLFALATEKEGGAR